MDVRRAELAIWTPFVLVTAIQLLSFIPFLHLRLDAVGAVAFVPLIALFVAVVRLLQVREGLDALVESAPQWMKRGFGLCLAYSSAAFLIGLNGYHGQPAVTPTGFALKDDGRVLRIISESEYWRELRGEVGLLFGFLIVFAYAAAALHTLASRHLAAAPNPPGPDVPAMNARPWQSPGW